MVRSPCSQCWLTLPPLSVRPHRARSTPLAWCISDLARSGSGSGQRLRLRQRLRLMVRLDSFGMVIRHTSRQSLACANPALPSHPTPPSRRPSLTRTLPPSQVRLIAPSKKLSRPTGGSKHRVTPTAARSMHGPAPSMHGPRWRPAPRAPQTAAGQREIRPAYSAACVQSPPTPSHFALELDPSLRW
mgnify:FL=1